MASMTFTCVAERTGRSGAGQPTRSRASRQAARERLIEQADRARASMGLDYGTNITGISSEDFKARMRRMMGRA